jgi:hypothetical protein
MDHTTSTNFSPDYITSSINKINVEILFNYAHYVYLELEKKKNENSEKSNDIERLEQQSLQILQNRFQIVDELTERKNKLCLVKKEVDIRKAHLNSLMKKNSNFIVKGRREKMDKFCNLISKVNNTSIWLSEFVGRLVSERNEQLYYLNPIENEAALVNLYFK